MVLDIQAAVPFIVHQAPRSAETAAMVRCLIAPPPPPITRGRYASAKSSPFRWPPRDRILLLFCVVAPESRVVPDRGLKTLGGGRLRVDTACPFMMRLTGVKPDVKMNKN